MLKKIEIRGFRSCRLVSISEISPLLALIGPNAAGKTSILKAIEWLAKFVSETTHDMWLYLTLSPDEQPFAILASVKIKRSTYEYRVDVSLDRDNKERIFKLLVRESLSVEVAGSEKKIVCNRVRDSVRVLGVDEPIAIGPTVSCLSAIESLLPASSAAVKAISPLLDFFRRVHYYSLDEPSDSNEPRYDRQIVPGEDYEMWLSRYQQNQDAGISVVMRLIYLHSEDKLSDLLDIVGPPGLHLVESISVEKKRWHSDRGSSAKPDTAYIVSFRLPNSPRTAFGYNQLSCGTRRMLRLLTVLVFDDSSLLLVEHPEDGVHTGLVKRLAIRIRGSLRASQLIMSTHSLTLLNCLKPEELRLITRGGTGTTARALSSYELALAGRFIAEDGGSLSDFVETMGD